MVTRRRYTNKTCTLCSRAMGNFCSNIAKRKEVEGEGELAKFITTLVEAFTDALSKEKEQKKKKLTFQDVLKLLSIDGFLGLCIKLRMEGEGEMAKFITKAFNDALSKEQERVFSGFPFSSSF